MMHFQSTAQVADQLGVTPGQIRYAMTRMGVMKRPPLSPWGFYLWCPSDVRRVAEARALVRPYVKKQKDER